MIEEIAYNNLNILISNLDLALPFHGGNKARKLIFIEKQIINSNQNALVTTGGIQSNHCRAAALLCARNGWQCKLILHGDQKEFYKQKGNALLMRMSGADIDFVTPSQIENTMNSAMNKLADEGFSPYYLYGGGHNKSGVQAYIDAIFELKNELGNDSQINHIFLASGTGSTQAGIILGLEEIGWQNTQVHGISIARQKEQGIKGVKQAIEFVKKDVDSLNILFYDNYCFGGYGISNEELNKFTTEVAKRTGIILDTTYTGKAYYGMLDIIKKNNLEGKILFWHTGGLLNLMA